MIQFIYFIIIIFSIIYILSLAFNNYLMESFSYFGFIISGIYLLYFFEQRTDFLIISTGTILTLFGLLMFINIALQQIDVEG